MKVRKVQEPYLVKYVDRLPETTEKSVAERSVKVGGLN
jgi:hypothetical protein